ncbi:MAG TPA: NAD-dependent epimerase/dehydratase family protein, partial [Archaeoglobus sp.]|nr:NAD-dependent epimerase/dehydratase family protein [Archaeoglobus sp.]
MILITGGCGYVGTALSSLLMRRGEEFRILDNLSGCSPLNLLFLNHVEFVWGDVRKPDDLKLAMKDVDIVVHLAAKLPTAPGMIDGMDGDVESVNYSGTKNVLEGDFGFFKLYEGNDYDKDILLNDLGEDFRGMELSIKPYPCCRMTHAS